MACLTGEHFLFQWSSGDIGGAIPCDVLPAFAAVARRNAFFAQRDKGWFVLVEDVPGLDATVYVVFDARLVVWVRVVRDVYNLPIMFICLLVREVLIDCLTTSREYICVASANELTTGVLSLPAFNWPH